MGIDGSVERLTEYIEYERRNSFPTWSVTTKRRHYKIDSRTADTPTEKKIVECAGAGIELTTFFVQGRCLIL